MVAGSPAQQYNSGSGALAEELALALADYRQAAEISTDNAFTRKAGKTIEFIEEWSDEIAE